MENGVEGGPREPLVAAASPICPKCKAYFRFTETFLDVRHFFDLNEDSSSGTKKYRRTLMATGLDRMKLRQEQSPLRAVCDDCNFPVSLRACVLDRRTGKLVRICTCPNCAKLIWDDDQQAARRDESR